MADCTYAGYLRSFTGVTSIEDRTITAYVFSKAWEETGHLPLAIYGQIWDDFKKMQVDDYKKELLISKPGIAPMMISQILQQGHSWSPKYHNHASVKSWYAYNPIELTCKFSSYGRERDQFRDEADVMRAVTNDAFAFATSDQFRIKLFIGLLHLEHEDLKKLESWNTDGTDGLSSELINAWFPSDGESEGYEVALSDPSNEQKYMHWDSTKVGEKGEYSICCKTSEEVKPYKITSNIVLETFKVLRKVLWMNTETATASTMKIYGQQGQGSADYQKLIGWIDRVKERVSEIKTKNLAKYVVGGQASTPLKCAEGVDLTKLEKLNVNIGSCLNCKDKEKCSCYNQIYAKTEDLILYINPKDVLAIEKGFTFIPNYQSLQITPQNLGVGKIRVLPECPEGKIRIINKNTIGRHPIFERQFGEAYYPEPDLHNRWYYTKEHIVIWPYHSFEISKPA